MSTTTIENVYYRLFVVCLSKKTTQNTDYQENKHQFQLHQIHIYMNMRVYPRYTKSPHVKAIILKNQNHSHTFTISNLLYMKKIVFIVSIVSLILISCSRVPFTNRRQAKLLPESTMNSMSFTQYDAFLKENRLSTNKQQVDMVKRVGLKVQKAAEVYYKANGLEKELENFQWEFNLVQNDTTINAWCMPGGKVVVYTGILPITKDENGLAVVMGHEIAHALANHGNERMSQQLAVQAGGVAIDVLMRDKPAETRNIFLQAYGVGTTVGALLPFSRKHESEADKIGLFLMAIAGYDVNAASPFWDRMGAGGGQAPPEFMSTHPSPETRAANLKAWAPEAIELAKKYKIQ